MKDFSTPEFQHLVQRYETLQKEGREEYIDSDDYIDLTDYYLQQSQPIIALHTIHFGQKQHPEDDMLKCVEAGVYIYLHEFQMAKKIVTTLNADDYVDVNYLNAQLAFAMDKDTTKADELFDKWLKNVESYQGDSDDDDDEERDEDREHDTQADLRDSYVHILSSYTELTDDAELKEKELEKWTQRYLEFVPDFGSHDEDKIVCDIVRDSSFWPLIVTVYTKLLESYPYIDNGWTILSTAHYRQNDLEEALNAAEFALAVKENDEKALIIKALSYYHLENFEKCLPAFLRYRELTASFQFDLNIGFSLIRCNRHSEAVDYLLSAEKLLFFSRTQTPTERARDRYELMTLFGACGELDHAIQLMLWASMTLPLTPDYKTDDVVLLNAMSFMSQLFSNENDEDEIS